MVGFLLANFTFYHLLLSNLAFYFPPRLRLRLLIVTIIIAVIFPVISPAFQCDFVRERLNKRLNAEQITKQVLEHCLSDDPRLTSGVGGDNMTFLLVLLNKTAEACRRREMEQELL